MCLINPIPEKIPSGGYMYKSYYVAIIMLHVQLVYVKLTVELVIVVA